MRHFRGWPSKTLNFWGIFEANPRKNLIIRGEVEGLVFKDFDHPTDNSNISRFQCTYLVQNLWIGWFLEKKSSNKVKKGHLMNFEGLHNWRFLAQKTLDSELECLFSKITRVKIQIKRLVKKQIYIMSCLCTCKGDIWHDIFLEIYIQNLLS